MRYLCLVLCLVVTACGPLTDHRGAPAPAPHCAASDAPAATKTAFTGKTWGDEAQRATVLGWIKRLTDEPRQVEASEGHAEETRGGPGCFSKIDGPIAEEFVSAIIYAGEKFLPPSLTFEQRWVLVAVEISAESAFVVSTAGANPGNTSYTSVGPLQWTKEIWTPIFKTLPPVPGLIHYDGSPWLPQDTTDDMMINSVWDNVVASTIVIMQQGRQGGPDNLGGPDGPMPKTVFSGHLCWVLGAPAARSGGDLANQRGHYRNSEKADLKMLGFEESLLDTPF